MHNVHSRRMENRMRPSNALCPLLDEVTVCAAFSLTQGKFATTENGADCDTLEKCQEHYRRTGGLLVWSGGGEHTIYDNPSVNISARVWHDYYHITRDLPFTMSGEYQVFLLQAQELERRADGRCVKDAHRLLYAEIIGQLGPRFHAYKILSERRR